MNEKTSIEPRKEDSFRLTALHSFKIIEWIFCSMQTSRPNIFDELKKSTRLYVKKMCIFIIVYRTLDFYYRSLYRSGLCGLLWSFIFPNNSLKEYYAHDIWRLPFQWMRYQSIQIDILTNSRSQRFWKTSFMDNNRTRLFRMTQVYLSLRYQKNIYINEQLFIRAWKVCRLNPVRWIIK